MIKTAIVTGIVWDVDRKSDAKDLPDTLSIEIPADTESEDNEEFISDAISDLTGFCHDDFRYTLQDGKPINIQAAIDGYVQKVQDASNAKFQKHYKNLWDAGHIDNFTTEQGKRWVKVVVTSPGSKAVFCFIDPTTGDLYKAAGWKAPAKGIRGNVLNEKVPLDLHSFYR